MSTIEKRIRELRGCNACRINVVWKEELFDEWNEYDGYFMMKGYIHKIGEDRWRVYYFAAEDHKFKGSKHQLDGSITTFVTNFDTVIDTLIGLSYIDGANWTFDKIEVA